VKTELNRMEKMNVITKMIKPTSVISPIVLIRKHKNKSQQVFSTSPDIENNCDNNLNSLFFTILDCKNQTKQHLQFWWLTIT
jgi:excinuclease UvrABC helicase subunit UvrB